ncbi:MAG: hypothetical protein AAF720_12960 [Pseudomonadota bacterium]
MKALSAINGGLILRRHRDFNAIYASLMAFVIVMAFSLGSNSTAFASAEIGVSPLRALLTPNSSLKEIRISNPSDRIIELRVSWTDLNATNDGYAPIPIEMRETLSAAPFLSVSPAFFRLEPGADAKVTISINKSALKNELNQNSNRYIERRSHLLFSSSAARTPLRKAGGGLQADLGLSISIPIHLRFGTAKIKQGEKRMRAEFSASQLVREDDGTLSIETDVIREGPFSIFGKLDAEFQAKGVRRAKPQALGSMDNATIHIENKRRRFRVRLNREELPAGVLTLRYVGRGEYSGRIFNEKVFSISGPK